MYTHTHTSRLRSILRGSCMKPSGKGFQRQAEAKWEAAEAGVLPQQSRQSDADMDRRMGQGCGSASSQG